MGAYKEPKSINVTPFKTLNSGNEDVNLEVNYFLNCLSIENRFCVKTNFGGKYDKYTFLIFILDQYVAICKIDRNLFLCKNQFGEKYYKYTFFIFILDQYVAICKP